MVEASETDLNPESEIEVWALAGETGLSDCIPAYKRATQ